MTRPVFRIDPAQLAEAAPGATVILDGAEGHHAATVRRLGVGEPLDVVDGQGRRASAEVAEVGDGRLTLRLQGPVRREQGSGLILVQALAKGDRDLQAIEMATELGVEAVIPWQAARSIVRWKAERARKAHEEWQKTVDAAAKQSRRALTPQVRELHRTADLERLAHGPALVILLHEQATTPLAQVLADHAGQRPTAETAAENPADPGQATRQILLVVGPEGGISPQERDRLVAAGARSVRLGHQVLRASTAGPAAIAVISARGRWR